MASFKNRQFQQEVNAGSMADIAFLLLIFFLVTTTILSDEGIRVKLPPYEEASIPPPPIPPKNILSVLVNASDELLVEGKPTRVEDLRSITRDFIMNPQKLTTLPTSPQNAIVSLKNDRATTYATYIAVYNELKGAYNELWNDMAQRQFGKYYDQLSRDRQKEIRNTIPLVISEAEPTDLATH